MNTLPPSERAKLGKVLPLLGSDKAGERDAAVLAAGRILAKAGVSWGDIIATEPPKPHRQPLIRSWRATCAELAARPGDLRTWEKGFIADLPKFPRLSMKQRYVLAEIADRVLGDRA